MNQSAYKHSINFNIVTTDIDLDRIKEKPVRIKAMLRFNNLPPLTFSGVDKIILGKYQLKETKVLVQNNVKIRIVPTAAAWDFDKQFPKNNVANAKISRNLTNVKNKISDLFVERCNDLGRFPDAQEAKELQVHINSILKNKVPKAAVEVKKEDVKTNNLLVYIYDYIKGANSNPATRLLKGQPYKKRSIQSFLNTLNILIEYKGGEPITFKQMQDPETVKQLPMLSFDEITLAFYDKFRDYLGVLGLGVSYFGSQIKYIKKFMSESLLEGFHSIVDWKDKRFAKQSAPAESDALTVDQLKNLADYDFSDTLVLDNARDLFLVGCWTGLRFSDYSRLNTHDHVDGDFIDILTKKTGEQVVIPILKELRKIMEKYSNRSTGITAIESVRPWVNEGSFTWFVGGVDTGVKSIIPKSKEDEGYFIDPISNEWIIKGSATGFPRAISDVKLNDYIKKACKIVGENLDKSFLKTKGVEISKISGIFTEYLPLCDRISTHTGRRSFATNATRLQIPKGSIMKITGHKTEAAFDAYVKIKSRENASILANHFKNVDL
ncbi:MULTISPECIES: tyrosine-type recombinase/integrase [Sphingobacterium]|uniref:tyrosine-type recombinase/integrase n=1 Tax=Sphingobacterium TaxID=28453 RepID=UPI00257CD7BB|nr:MULTISPECIES: tyrosine-type recombinase/integrase [Sphingobacterium]